MSENYQKQYRQLVARAARDAEFRAALKADPRAAIQAELGVAVPDGVKLHVLEESAQDLYLVLPPALSANAPRELSESDLEAVAGGSGWFGCCYTSDS